MRNRKVQVGNETQGNFKASFRLFIHHNHVVRQRQPTRDGSVCSIAFVQLIVLTNILAPFVIAPGFTAKQVDKALAATANAGLTQA